MRYFFIVALGLSTVITKPIARLSEIMQKASEGEWEIYGETASIAEITELNGSYNKLASHTNYLVKTVYEKELLYNQSEIKALQAQINPHFLFNTLTALYWSLEEKGEEELAEAVISMSELFRYTIDQAEQKQWVTLDAELKHINRYLDIMKIRLGNQIIWKIECENRFRNVKIPKLMIQPIVENAVLHGIENSIGLGMITVKVSSIEKDSQLLITVEDNGKGMNKEELKRLKERVNTNGEQLKTGKSIGLININKRLRLYYGKAFDLRIESVFQRGTRVSFPIAIKRGEDDES